MNLKRLNEKLDKVLNEISDDKLVLSWELSKKKAIKSFNESYSDWADTDINLGSVRDVHTESYHLIEVEGTWAIFVHQYVKGEILTEKVSEWFNTKEEAMDYFEEKIKTTSSNNLH